MFTQIPILVGPTGVGKSEVAFELALRLNAEIISSDAFQVYAGMEIGTAQPSREWQKKVRHHLVGIRNPSDAWNAVEFAKAARKIIDEKEKENREVLIVGGAGFYLKALVEGAPSGTAPSAEIRSMVEDQVAQMGNHKAHQWLQTRDPEAAQRLHPNDLQRVSRALEKTFTPPQPLPDLEPLGVERVRFIGLERSRENLDALLRRRTQTMWETGLLDETQVLQKLDLDGDHPFWGAIGYAEAAAFLRKEMTEAEALEKIFRRTRQYAKRQWTWFKHQHEVEWVNLDDYQDVSAAVDELDKRIKQK